MLFLIRIRSPSVSRIRAKMLYATSKDRFKREIDGFHYDIQATDPSELDIEVLRDRAHWTGLFNRRWIQTAMFPEKYHLWGKKDYLDSIQLCYNLVMSLDVLLKCCLRYIYLSMRCELVKLVQYNSFDWWNIALLWSKWYCDK